MTTERNWAVGVTTVPERKDNTFPRTMDSLCDAGFEVDRIFVDGAETGDEYKPWGIPTTCRYPNIRTHGNWVLGLYELFIRYPHAAHYAMFQDDLVCCRNLREYLERVEKPASSYLNLYTFPENQQLAHGKPGWFRSNQKGKGAVGLVFSNAAVYVLLTHPHMFGRPTCPKRGHKAIDGGIVDSFRKAGWQEVCHNPSLIQHTGEVSSMGNRKHPPAPSFPGEDFDALSLL